MELTHEQLVDLFKSTIAAQSMLLAAVIRPLIEKGRIAADADLAAVIAGDELDLAARHRHHVPHMAAAPAPQHCDIAWTRVGDTAAIVRK